MNDLLKLPGVDRATIAKAIGILLIVNGIFWACCGAGTVFLGGLTGIAAIAGGSVDPLMEFAESGMETAVASGAMSGAELEQAQATLQAARQEFQDASGEIAGLGGFSILLVIFGLFSIVTGPLSVIVGIGLLTRQPWARMGVVLVAGLTAVTGLFGLFGGQGIGNILWALLAAVVAYFFYTDALMKDYLDSKPKNA
jgi:hypothetical protein